MKLIILGSGVCVPSPKRVSSGYFLQTDFQNFLLDTGTGCLHNLAKSGMNYLDIDAIFYTHLHVDHVADLVTFLFALKNDPLSNRTKDLYLYGPVGFAGYFEKLKDLYGDTIANHKFEIKIIELKDGDFVEKNNLKIQTAHVEHTDNSLGYRFASDNKVITFSGDSGYCDNIIKLSQDSDLAILECSAPEEYQVQGHLTPTLAGKVAQEANVKRLILSHIYPGTDQYPLSERCEKQFDGEVIIAQDLQVFEI